MFSCQRRKSKRAAKTPSRTNGNTTATITTPCKLRHKWRQTLPGSSFWGMGRLWSWANLMFPALTHVVQQPLMTVKYNAKLLSYFNCKRGESTKGQTGSSNAPTGNVYIPAVFTSPGWHRAGRGQGSGNSVHKKCPTDSTLFSVSDRSASAAPSEP